MVLILRNLIEMGCITRVLAVLNTSIFAPLFLARRVREASYFYAKAKRWPRFNIKMIPELILDDREQLHSSLTELFRSRIKEIILLCDQRDLYHIMNEVTCLFTSLFSFLIHFCEYRASELKLKFSSTFSIFFSTLTINKSTL